MHKQKQPKAERLDETEPQEEFSLETCSSNIKEVAADMGRSVPNRQHGMFAKGMLKLLCRAERKLSNNYGVEREPGNANK